MRTSLIENLCLIIDELYSGESKEGSLDSDGVLRIEDRICVPNTGYLTRLILEKAYCA